MDKIILSILVIIFALDVCISQEFQADLSPNFEGAIQYKDNAIRLRYFIDNPAMASIGFEKGYIIEKSVNGMPFQELGKSPVNIWPKEKLKQFIRTTDKDPYWVELSHQLASGDFGQGQNKPLDQANQNLSAFNQMYKNLNDQVCYAYLGTVMDFDAALAIGIAIYDTDVVANSYYRYRIKPNFETLPLIIKPLELSITTQVNMKKNELKNIVIIEKDKELEIHLKKDSLYFTYFFDRSIDSLNYTRDKDIPSIQLDVSESFDDNIFRYTEDSLNNYVKYYYKVYGKDRFGDETLVGVCSGMPRDKTPPRSPYLISVEHTEPEIASITWSIEETEPLRGFRVGRSDKDNGVFYQLHDEIIPADWRSFTDSYFDNELNNYYLIEAIDTAGNVSKSNIALLSLVDSIPPEIPIPLKGTMDSVGIVTLELNPQDEKDFMGYRVYTANSPTSEFSLIEETYNDSIVDNARIPIIIDSSTIESLTPYVYYKIGALDYHYNESKPSEIIKVKRPDIYPPVSPLIIGYKAFPDSILLDIVLSTSFDVRENFIYRRKANQGTWSILDSLGTGSKATYVDSTGESKVDYIYSLKAIDESGLESEFGNQLELSIYKDESKDLNVNIYYFIEEKKALVTWKAADELDIQSYSLIFYLEEEKFSKHETKNENYFSTDLVSKPFKVLLIPNSRQDIQAIEKDTVVELNGLLEQSNEYKDLKDNFMNPKVYLYVLLISCFSHVELCSQQKLIPEYVLNIEAVAYKDLGVLKKELRWIKNNKVKPENIGTYLYTNDDDIHMFRDHYKNKAYPNNIVHRFDESEIFEDVWLNEPIQNHLGNKSRNIDWGSFYPQLSLGFPFYVDKGQTLIEVLEKYNEQTILSPEFEVQFELLVSKLPNHPNNSVHVVGSASNVFFGINCQDYSSDSICNLLSVSPQHKIGLLDCDKGGESNYTECLNNRDPKSKNDDNLSIPNERLIALNEYNTELAEKRSLTGIEFFQIMYKEINNTENELVNITNSSKVTEKSFRSLSDKFNFNQSVLFNFNIFE